MANRKRSLEGDATGLDDVHASRKKRFKYTEEDALLADIYNRLADEVESKRIEAAAELLRKLSTKSSDQTEQLETAEARLIKGLCSGRKAARLGFSIALTEVFRFKFKGRHGAKVVDTNLVTEVDKAIKLTTSEGNVSGQEKRDHLLGRRFAFQAVLQSDVGLLQHLPDDHWKHLIDSIYALAAQKQWLRRECGYMLYEYLASPSASKLDPSRIRTIIDELVDSKLAKTPEGVAIWLLVQEKFAGVKLLKGVWHHRDPLSSKELPLLTKILLDTASEDEPSIKASGSRQSSPSFAWSVILSQFYQRGNDEKFAKFWDSAVARAMFSLSSSAERKALGLQIFSLAIIKAPKSMLSHMLSCQSILKCMLDQRTDPERYLFDAAKIPLNQMVTRCKNDPQLAAVFLKGLVQTTIPNFDQMTKSKTIESIIVEADENALEEIVAFIESRIESTDASQNNVENHRRMLADLLLNIVRIHHQSKALLYDATDDTGSSVLTRWVRMLLDSFISFGYSRQDPNDPMISKGSQAIFRGRLMSCLGCLLDNPLERAVLGPLYVTYAVPSFYRFLLELSPEERLAAELGTQAVNTALTAGSYKGIARAMQLLLSLCVIQVYNKEPDSLAALEDLLAYHADTENSENSSTSLIELLLTFLSKPAALFRKLAEQVFIVFAPQLNSECLESLTDILGQKESLSGQQALFDTDRDDGEEQPIAQHEDDVMDVEDVSDVELVNGQQSSILEDDDHDGSIEDSSEAEEDGSGPEQDEVAAFDKKLADALGTAGMEDSDDDGSDMDDEQMMALEPHLTSIFKERQKSASKKNDNKGAKENIVNFKQRVLDLLVIYVKSQFSNVLALDLILPLTTLIRTTTSKPISEKAFAVLKQYFESCNKNKKLPAPHDQQACFEVLEAVHGELKLGGSKLHANACSRSSLFMSKVLVALDPQHYERIANLYANLQSEWYLDPNSRIQGSVFTEWTSWSISTRKQR